MTTNRRPRVIFGKAEEWADFDQRHPRFAERLPRLKSTLEALFAPAKTPRLVDRVVRNLLRTCVEDFFEILLLAGNGYGVGAQKLLRGLYERAVTARYLSAHPRKARAFWSFARINMYSLMAPLEKAHGRTDLIPEKIKRDLIRFHKRYTHTAVKTATGKTRRRSTGKWSDDLSFEAIAETCGSFGKILPYGWHLPTFQDHATAQNMLTRIEQTPGGDVAFIDGPQREIADDQLIWAHLILLDVAELQARHFRRFRKMRRALQEIGHDFQDIWHGHCSEAGSSPSPVGSTTNAVD